MVQVTGAMEYKEGNHLLMFYYCEYGLMLSTSWQMKWKDIGIIKL